MRTPYRKPGRFSQIKPDPFLTPGKFNEIKNRLERLKNIVQPRAAAEVSRLAEMGDFSENAAYQLAKWRLRGMNQSILDLEKQLNRAVIITPSSRTDTVQIGHTVTIAQGDKQRTYQILGSSETNPQKGIISHTSPIGAALLGHRVGDIVKILLAKKVVEYRVIKISAEA